MTKDDYRRKSLTNFITDHHHN